MAYTQLTQEQRYQIYAMNQIGISQKEISMSLCVNPSTISREIRRHTDTYGRYSQDAHQMALNKRLGKSKQRITPEQWNIVTDYLRDEVSPEQIYLRLKYLKRFSISHEWIYQYILKDKKQGGDLYKHLRCKKKNRKRYGVKHRQTSIRNKVSIEERPKIVDGRKRYGDWEVDTVIGRQGGAVLVTVVERKSRLSVIGLSNNKTAQSVKEIIVKLLSSLSSCVHTLTYDNGPEFARHEEVDKALDSNGYFCHPFASGERGTNENTNGLIRQYLPKKSSFDSVSKGTVQWIADKLNNRPRKCLGGRTPNEVFFAGNRIALTS
jgi:IS30 family transposase